MLRLLLCSLLRAAGHLRAQSETISVPLEGETSLHLSANFSNVRLTTGDGPGIEVEHQITINGVPRPDLADLEVTRTDGVLSLSESHPTLSELNPEWKRNSDGDRTGYDDDRHIEVSLVVRVPRWLAVVIETVYGSVEVSDVGSLREVAATYGGVTVIYAAAAPSDLQLYSNYGSVNLTLPASTDATLDLTTEFGELLTDFDLAIDTGESERREFYEHVVGTIGAGGAQVQCRAPYGKVYLRRGK